jgi:hypoxanthine phosphoribosyltransferase
MEKLYSEARIKDRVTVLARSISQDYMGEEIVLIPLLKGAFIFAADLIKAITVPCEVDFLHVTSYKNTESTGKIEFHNKLSIPITRKHVIIVDDILDTGLTLREVRLKLSLEQPRSIKTCVMLNKQPIDPRKRLPADYIGFNVGKDFVIGYGLDLNEKYRDLNYIARVK